MKESDWRRETMADLKVEIKRLREDCDTYQRVQVGSIRRLREALEDIAGSPKAGSVFLSDKTFTFDVWVQNIQAIAKAALKESSDD